MDWELVLKTISVLIIIKALVIILFPQQIMSLTKKMMKSKSSLRKTALIYLIAGLIVYLIVYRLL